MSPHLADALRTAHSTTEVEYVVKQIMLLAPRDKYETDAMYFARLLQQLLPLIH